MTDFKDIRLIVSDMDGTILLPSKEFSTRTVNAVRSARQAGIAFTFASGRTLAMQRMYIDELDIDIPVIACNGAVVVNVHTGEMPYEALVPESIALDILRWCEERQLDFLAYTENATFFSPWSRRIERFHEYNRLADHNGYGRIDIRYFGDDFRDVTKLGVIKLLITELHGRDIEQSRAMLAQYDGLSYISSEPDVLDIMKAGCSKGAALVGLCEFLGVAPHEVCAFGDYMNDYDMLQAAGVAVAMPQAPDELKAVADIIADPHEEDGVAKVIEQIVAAQQV